MSEEERVVEDYELKRPAEAFLAEQLDGRKRAERLEEVLRQAVQRVKPGGEVDVLVIDVGKGECLVAFRCLHTVVQVRFWRGLVDEFLVDQDPRVQQVLERIVAGALAP